MASVPALAPVELNDATCHVSSAAGEHAGVDVSGSRA